MKENLQKHSRWLLLAVVMIFIHIVVALAIRGCGTTGTDPQSQGDQQDSVKVEQKESSPGFWERLFGKKETPKTQETAPEKQEPPKPEEPKKEVITYHRTCKELPQFGKPFDFSKARHGELPEYFVPGSKNAKSAIVVDLTTRKVLWEKNCRLKTGTASMAKLMTLLLFMEHLDSKEDITLDTVITVPKGVMRVPRSGVVYLAPGEQFKYSDIVKAASIKSANDAAEMLALGVVDDISKFPEIMNNKAAILGMTSTNFVNAHGLTEKNGSYSTSSALDMVILGERLLEYPVLMSYFSTQQASLREQKPLIYTNTNKLVNPRYPGVDGMKTGFTRAAGFCLVFSAKRDGKRIMGCVTGFKSRVDRDRFCRKLVDWAFNPDKKITPAKSSPKKTAVKSSGRKTKKQASPAKNRKRK
ncbi:MAG: D-alanyl-D-alanine carboxypeptidase [Lentisphaeria bacterium]|nr:D-alanyl-D-alanine carboxypeptidase [Lentisphaeria bacterium]